MTHSKDDPLVADIRRRALAKIEEARARARAKIKQGTTDENHKYEDGHIAEISKVTAEARIAEGNLKYLDEIYADVEHMELME